MPAPAAERNVVSVHRVSQRAAWIPAAIMVFIVGPIGAYFGGPLAMLVTVAAAIAWSGVLLLAAPRAIVLYEDGLEVRYWIGATRAIGFDDVVSVFFDFGVRTTVLGTGVTDATWWLEDESGRRVRVPGHVGDAKPLFEAIDRSCVQPVRVDAIAAFDDGETLSFGPLSLWRKGMSINGHYVGWDRVARIEASPRRIFVRVKGELVSRSVAYARVPFAGLFLDLVDRSGRRVEYIEGFVRRV